MAYDYSECGTKEGKARKLMEFTGAFALGLRGLPMLVVREGRFRHQIGRFVRC
jgi:hypothetical protein